jgi:hypothetical protein
LEYNCASVEVRDYWEHVLQSLVIGLLGQPHWKKFVETNKEKVQCKPPSHVIRLILEDVPMKLCLEETARYREADGYLNNLGVVLAIMDGTDGMVLCSAFAFGRSQAILFTSIQIAQRRK